MRSIADNFGENERGRASSFFLSAQTAGGVIGSIAYRFLLVSFGWRWMFVSIGIAGVFIAWAIWAYLKSSDDKQKQLRHKLARKSIIKWCLKRIIFEISLYEILF